MGGAGFDIAVIGIGLIAAACFVGLVFLGVYCWTLYIAMKAAASVPSAHRRFEPGLVWLMLIHTAGGTHGHGPQQACGHCTVDLCFSDCFIY